MVVNDEVFENVILNVELFGCDGELDVDVFCLLFEMM